MADMSGWFHPPTTPHTYRMKIIRDEIMSELSKNKPYRSKKYLKWIRSHPCVVTGREYDIVAHHIINCGFSGVIGSKVSDLFTIPLNSEIHQQLHHNPKAFEQRYDQKRLALEFIDKAISEGVFV